MRTPTVVARVIRLLHRHIEKVGRSSATNKKEVVHYTLQVYFLRQSRMITCRPGGYRWFLMMDKIKKQERYLTERQRIIDEIEEAKKHIATIKIASPPQSIRYTN